MFSGDPIGHCYKTNAPKLKSDKESGDERLQPPSEENVEMKGVKRDSSGATVMSSGAVISLTNSDLDAVSEREFDPLLSSDERLVEGSEPKPEDQPKVMGLQVRKHLVLDILLSFFD